MAFGLYHNFKNDTLIALMKQIEFCLKLVCCAHHLELIIFRTGLLIIYMKKDIREIKRKYYHK